MRIACGGHTTQRPRLRAYLPGGRPVRPEFGGASADVHFKNSGQYLTGEGERQPAGISTRAQSGAQSSKTSRHASSTCGPLSSAWRTSNQPP